ncbi:MAG: NAD(P)/FAD-dependent oxidoreductase [Pseudomonadota bacterium]
MSNQTRRTLLKGLGGSALAASIASPAVATDAANPPFVIIGGGFGGATAALELKRLFPGSQVTLIERSATYTACPFSNLVVGGLRELSAQQFSYDGLRRLGIDVVIDEAIAVDPDGKSVSVAGGSSFDYERLILSPGIDLRWNAIEGYDDAAAERMPHAWKAGAQTELLWRQIEAMDDGGLVMMAAPAAPYRCPPGPYERASLIANYLKTQKPRSKLIILDSKDRFSKMPLFQKAWAELYPDHLEWRSATEDGRVSRVDAALMSVETDFSYFTPDVANIIPPQKAGKIADIAGVADATGWCPINGLDFMSTLVPDIHVIGDASIANPMPKSAFSASLQARLCAFAIATPLAFDGAKPDPTTLANTCYSYVAPDQAVSISGVYTNEGGTLASIPGAGGLSPIDDPVEARQLEAIEARDWFRTVTRGAFG